MYSSIVFDKKKKEKKRANFDSTIKSMGIAIKFVQLLMREFGQFIGRVSNIFCSHIDFLAEYRTDDGEQHFCRMVL